MSEMKRKTRWSILHACIDKNKIKTTKFKRNSLNSTRPKYVADVAIK